MLAVAALEFETSPQMWENLGAVLSRVGPLSGARDLGEVVGRPGTAWIAHRAATPEAGLVAATLAKEGVRLFSTLELEPIEFPSYGPSPAVALSPDGTQLAVAEDGVEPAIRLYDLPAGVLSQRQVHGLPVGGIDYSSVDFSGDGTRIRVEVLGPEERGPADNLVGSAVIWDVARPSRPVFVERFPAPSVASEEQMYGAVAVPGCSHPRAAARQPRSAGSRPDLRFAPSLCLAGLRAQPLTG